MAAPPGVYVAVFGATPACYLCVHGVARSLAEAGELARTVVRGGAPDPEIVDLCNRWIRLRPPGAAGAAEEEEEVAVEANEDRERGRDGSVCDLKPRGRGPPAAPATPAPAGAGRRGDVEQGVQGQRRQLQALLDAPVAPPGDGDAAAYARLRERYATLRAFERKLAGLVAESRGKCAAAWAAVEALDARHPGYAAAYRGRYTQALRESGIPEERVGFMSYL